MVTTDQLRRSKAVHRRTGRTFYLATRLLPERVRHPTYVLYAFFRKADEVVDDAKGVSPERQREQLDHIRTQVLGEQPPTDPVFEAFRTVKNEYDIADRHVREFLDAMYTDIETTRYDTYAQLETYIEGSAAAVGQMMTTIMQPEDPERARPYARKLGQAFQLTNFLRDVREDVVDRNRIYLPRETLSAHGVTEAQIQRLEMSDGFARAMRLELRRTEALYRAAVPGISLLPRDCQFPVLLASVLYADHHRAIRDCGFDVLNVEPRIGTKRKLSLLVRTYVHWRLSGDPETVFRRISAISYPPNEDRRPVPVAGAN